MKNEWRDNVWLVVELAVVCVAIWFIGVILYFHIQGVFQPRGFDPHDVYMLKAMNLKQTNPNYQATGNDDTDEGRAAGGRTLSRDDFGDPDTFSASKTPVSSADSSLMDTERSAIEAALKNAGGNMSRAARALGITRQALYRRLEKYGIR